MIHKIKVCNSFFPIVFRECLSKEISITSFTQINPRTVEITFDDNEDRVRMFLGNLLDLYRVFCENKMREEKVFSS